MEANLTQPPGLLPSLRSPPLAQPSIRMIANQDSGDIAYGSAHARLAFETGPLGTLDNRIDELEAAVTDCLGQEAIEGDLGRSFGEARQACRRIAGQSTSIPTVAIVGAQGEGKSWLASRVFLLDHEDNELIRREIPTGPCGKHRTDRLTWFGPIEPIGRLDDETYLRVSASQMLDLGREYVVGEGPGTTDLLKSSKRLARAAIAAANVKIVVTHRGNIRTDDLADLFDTLDGSIILPAVRLVGDSSEPDGDFEDDYQSGRNEWTSRAPRATILDPIFIPDKDIFSTGDGDPEAQTVELVRRRLREGLTDKIGSIIDLKDAQARQASKARRDLEAKLRKLLAPVKRCVGGAVEALDNLRRELPSDLMKEMVGDDETLALLIAHQLRGEMLRRTWPIFFPYRPILGITALAQGAWDSLVFGMTGSVFSLARAAFQALRTIWKSREVAARLRSGVSKKIIREAELKCRQESKDLANGLTNARKAIAVESLQNATMAPVMPFRIGLSGIELFEDKIVEIIQETTKELGPHKAFLALAGLVGALAFWVLASGPILALYYAYLSPFWGGAAADGPSWMSYPTPSASMLATSLMLSAGPVFLLSIIVVAFVVRTGRVSTISKEVRRKFEEFASESGASLIDIDVSDRRLKAIETLLALWEDDEGSGIMIA